MSNVQINAYNDPMTPLIRLTVLQDNDPLHMILIHRQRDGRISVEITDVEERSIDVVILGIEGIKTEKL